MLIVALHVRVLEENVTQVMGSSQRYRECGTVEVNVGTVNL